MVLFSDSILCLPNFDYCCVSLIQLTTLARIDLSLGIYSTRGRAVEEDYLRRSLMAFGGFSLILTFRCLKY